MDLNLGTKSRTTSRALHVSHSAGPDLLRALAILLVMLWHLPPTATPALLTGLKPFSWIGVDLFFVLSGFLIGTQLLAPIRSVVPALVLAIVIVLMGMAIRFAIWNDVIGAKLETGEYKGLGFLYMKDIYYPTYCRLDGLVFGVLLAAAKIFWPDIWR